MVAVAAAQLEHIVPDVTHPTKWETTASRVYVPMGSPGPAISTNPPELSMEVPAAPNQSWNNYDVAGYHLMQALFPPEIHEQLQNIVKPERQTLEEWPVHGAGYPGVRLQTQRDAVTWFPLPLQNALYTAIYEQWVFLKDSDTLGTVLYTRPEDTNTEDWAGYEPLHRMHHWSRAYAHLTHMVIVPLQDVEAAQALQVQVGSHRGQHTANKMHTLPMKLGDALLMNGPLFVRFGGGKSRYLVFTFLPHGVRKVLPCVEGPEVMEMACKQPPLPTPQEREFDMGECTHVPVPWQYMGDVVHLCRHIADCNMWLAVKGVQYTDIAPDGEDDVPNCSTPWVHRWWVPAVSNARVPRLNLQMGDVAFAFVPAAWGFTKQPTFEVMSYSQMAHYWGALTPVDNLRNAAQWKVDRWVCNCQYQVCTYGLPCSGARHSLF